VWRRGLRPPERPPMNALTIIAKAATAVKSIVFRIEIIFR
jgi:hypothetical protein